MTDKALLKILKMALNNCSDADAQCLLEIAVDDLTQRIKSNAENTKEVTLEDLVQRCIKENAEIAQKPRESILDVYKHKLEDDIKVEDRIKSVYIYDVIIEDVYNNLATGNIVVYYKTDYNDLNDSIKEIIKEQLNIDNVIPYKIGHIDRITTPGDKFINVPIELFENIQHKIKSAERDLGIEIALATNKSCSAYRIKYMGSAKPWEVSAYFKYSLNCNNVFAQCVDNKLWEGK